MACPKSCLAAPGSRDFAGTVEVAPMPELDNPDLPASPDDLRLVTPADLVPLFPPRPRDSYKGTYGRVLLVGGSPLYPGALVLATEAATRSGAGLVRACTSPSAVAAILARCPEAIARDDLYGELPLAEHPSAILCGSGLGRDAEARRIVATLLHETPAPLVLDADALSMLGSKTDALRACTRPLLLTPHAAEAASLLGCAPADIQRDRPAAATELARRSNATVLLKGDGTLIATPGSDTLWINLCGNPGMATAGSGDVLAGLLAGLLAQGVPAPDAARAATWLHGTAGDIAARRLGDRPLRASDIAATLPAAFRSLHRPTA
jgi:NAD(P)H-hydrate epimerase